MPSLFPTLVSESTTPSPGRVPETVVYKFPNLSAGVLGSDVLG